MCSYERGKYGIKATMPRALHYQVKGEKKVERGHCQRLYHLNLKEKKKRIHKVTVHPLLSQLRNDYMQQYATKVSEGMALQLGCLELR